MSQEHGEKNSSREDQDGNETMSLDAAAQAIASANQQTELEGEVSSIDAMLDEIDGVLEENAETFMDAFIQKGGQ